jgi:hypothetical protein
LMERIVCYFFLFFFAGSIFAGNSAQARPAQEKRRIEEEKRNNLAPTEAFGPLELKSIPPQEAKPDLNYLTQLLNKKSATLEDACRVMVILLGEQERLKDFSRQIAYFKDKNILPEKIMTNVDPRKPLTRGVTAYMFCRALNIKGGIILRIFGTSQRYALLELEQEEIMSGGDVKEVLSGQELVDIFSRAAEYLVNEIQSRQEQK